MTFLIEFLLMADMSLQELPSRRIKAVINTFHRELGSSQPRSPQAVPSSKINKSISFEFELRRFVEFMRLTFPAASFICLYLIER